MTGAVAMAEALDAAPGRLSPTLVAAFLGCSASAAWTLEARRGLRAAAVTVEDPHAALIVRKGHEHEAACLAALREQHGDFVEVPSGSVEARFAATVEAMDAWRSPDLPGGAHGWRPGWATPTSSSG